MHPTIMRHLLLTSTAVLLLAPAAPAQIDFGFNRFNDGSPFRASPEVLRTFRPVVAKAALSTVRIKCDGKAVALGTVVHPDGYVLTKASELKPGKLTVHDHNGRTLEAQRVATHDHHDLATLKVEARDLSPVAWSPSGAAPVGNWVASAGPGEEPVTIGVISVAARNVPAPRVSPPPQPPANSGYLGIMMGASDYGAKIDQVTPNTPAEKAGLKAEDIIVSLNGKPVTSPEQLGLTLQTFKGGDTVRIVVHRGEQVIEKDVKLDRRPANLNFNRGEFQNRLGSELSEKRTGFPTVLQHDSVIKPADCGGPLVDLDGRVIGINIARAGRTESYALPSEVIVPLLTDLIAGKTTGAVALPAANPAAKPPMTPAEKVEAARAALKVAEAEKTAADKKVAGAKDALEKALAEEKAAADKKD